MVEPTAGDRPDKLPARRGDDLSASEEAALRAAFERVNAAVARATGTREGLSGLAYEHRVTENTVADARNAASIGEPSKEESTTSNEDAKQVTAPEASQSDRAAQTAPDENATAEAAQTAQAGDTEAERREPSLFMEPGSAGHGTSPSPSVDHDRAASANAPEASASNAADTASSSNADEVSASANEKIAPDASEGTDETDGEQAAKPNPIPEVLTPRSLIFLAPDLPPVSERPRRRQRDEQGSASGRSGRSDRGSRDDDRADEPQPKTRRRGRRGGTSREVEVDTEPEIITEPQKVKGSTRLEAKRQRRREGRETGRRRQVVTETEFQARRDAAERTMIVRGKDGRVQIGVLEDKVLVEHYVARADETSLIGNVYLGRVQNVLPSMEAAFVDIGHGRNAVLYSGEVDWASADLGANQPRKIENALKSGDRVLVQVTKDPVGHKGARLTSQISLPGRYLVYVPGNTMNGISRKLPDTERARLKKILKEVLPSGVGVIVRTAAEGATKEQLERDVKRLMSQWESISARSKTRNAPAVLQSEPDLTIKIIRDVFNEDFQELVIQGDKEFETISSYLEQMSPDLVDRVRKFEGEDIFVDYRANEQLEKALDRKVWLPSGGSLIIDRTEAMTVVDVNTGKFVGSGGNLEETVTKNNLEAAEEVVRQLRLRDIGGIVVIDFIDMVLESNRDLVQRRLVECLSRDRTKHQVAEVTSLGLVQMTRKKIGLGLLETFSTPCETCSGRGVVVHHEPVADRDAHEQSGSKRRGRKGGNADKQQSQRNTQSSSQSAHANQVTEMARNALSQIAASTLATAERVADQLDDVELTIGVDGAAASKEWDSAETASADSAPDGSPDESPHDSDSNESASRTSRDEEAESSGRGSRRGRRGRRGRGRSRDEASAAGDASSDEASSAPKASDAARREESESIATDLAELAERGGADASTSNRPASDSPAASEQSDASLDELNRVLDSLPGAVADAAPDTASATTGKVDRATSEPTTSEASTAPSKASQGNAEPRSRRGRRGQRRRISTGTLSTGDPDAADGESAQK